MNSFPDFSLLESCQLYIIAKYRASNCCKIEAVIQRCSVKVFLKILQNSEENPCARVPFLIKLQLKKTLAQVFSSKYCKNFINTFLYRAPLVDASCKIRIKSLKLAKCQFQLFFITLDIMGSLYITT